MVQSNCNNCNNCNAYGNNILHLFYYKYSLFEGLRRHGFWAKESPDFIRRNPNFGLRKPQWPEKHGKWTITAINTIGKFYLHT